MTQRFSPRVIRAVRRQLGLTQRQFADRLGVNSFVTISRWENGHNKPEGLAERQLAKLVFALQNGELPEEPVEQDLQGVVPMPESAQTNEPTIVINGITLTTAQAMTVRVAIGNFAIGLQNGELGNDEIGRGITAGYLAAVKSIHAIMRLS